MAEYLRNLFYEQLQKESDGELVEVVRCRDCRYAQQDKLFGGYWCKGKRRLGDWFCADGERREGEEE